MSLEENIKQNIPDGLVLNQDLYEKVKKVFELFSEIKNLSNDDDMKIDFQRLESEDIEYNAYYLEICSYSFDVTDAKTLDKFTQALSLIPNFTIYPVANDMVRLTFTVNDIYVPLLKDRWIKCKDCGKSFLYPVKTQKKFFDLGFQAPIRCPECRKKHKQRIEDHQTVKECVYGGSYIKPPKNVIKDGIYFVSGGMTQ